MEILPPLLLSILSGIIAGIVVVLFQYFYKRNKSKKIDSIIHKKTIKSDIFEKLKPTTSLNKVKDLLGIPDKIFTDGINEFNENDKFEREFWLYEFENCFIKISSKDKRSVESYTVMNRMDTSDIKISFLGIDVILGKTKLNTTFIYDSSLFCEARTYKDLSFGVGNYYGNPLHLFITYYGLPESEKLSKDFPKQATDLEGMIIDTISISENNEVSFYIYTYEIA